MRVGIYLADQVWQRTLSKGIYSYSRTLVSELLPRLAGHEVVLILNAANRADMRRGVADGVRIIELPAVCSGGAARLAADHLAAPLLARRLGLDLIHFPKGFVPWFSCGRARVTATIHDTIPLVYQTQYPGFFPRLKLAYLRRMLCHSLRRSHGIMTDSTWSRDMLLRLAQENGIVPPPIEICPLTPDPQLTDVGPDEPPGREPPTLLHLGSRLPHKRTRETVELFRHFNRARGLRWRLRIVGLSRFPEGWGLAPGQGVELLGTLSNTDLRREMRQARALLLLSSVEGFGLPALEAWFLGTPVVYAPAGALAEVLAGVPGACEDVAPEAFERALDEVLGLEDSRIAVVRDRLRDRYAAERLGERAATVFCDWLARPGRELEPRPVQRNRG